MRKFELKRSWITRARKRAVLEPQEIEKIDALMKANKSAATIHASINEFPKIFWQAMLNEANLHASIRTAITLHLFGMREGACNLDSMYQVEVESPSEFGNALQLSNSALNAEININGRWYPVSLWTEFLDDQEKVTYAVRLNCSLVIGDRSFSSTNFIAREVFVDGAGNKVTRSLLEVLERFGYRRLQTSASEYNLRLVRAERLSTEWSKVVDVSNSVVAPARYSWWRGFEIQSLGMEEMPSRCIVESELEVDEDSRHSYHSNYRSSSPQSHLPFVRLFSLETKSYVYADIDDIEEYEFQTEALERLHLPKDMHGILSRVFNTPVEKMFGDLLNGKHGGVVVMASGSTGVGKTLTAEIYAETTERPLYVLELGELGTTANDVEANLQRVFARVTRWNAVLQFDECEIFLAKRGNELERSAIVGIFLRLLDYYRGLLFLTTNRPEVLDDAVLSRIMLRLKYPDLDAATRANIWKTMFSLAGMKLKSYSFDELGKHELNGRQIRNITRLAKILNPDGELDRAAIEEALKFGTPSNIE